MGCTRNAQAIQQSSSFSQHTVHMCTPLTCTLLSGQRQSAAAPGPAHTTSSMGVACKCHLQWLAIADRWAARCAQRRVLTSRHLSMADTQHLIKRVHHPATQQHSNNTHLSQLLEDPRLYECTPAHHQRREAGPLPPVTLLVKHTWSNTYVVKRMWSNTIQCIIIIGITSLVWCSECG